MILTIDIEWAPDYMLDYCFDLISESGFKTTIFATHNSPVIQNVSSKIEVGLHPNISNLDEIREKISELKHIYPEARCIRNHRLIHSSVFTKVYSEFKLSVTSNYLMIDQKNIKPIPMLYNIKEYPIFFADDVFLFTHNLISISSLMEKIKTTEGLKVLAFHPIHIYLNSENLEKYNAVKNNLNDKKMMDSAINKGKGIGSIFKEILSASWLKEQMEFFPI